MVDYKTITAGDDQHRQLQTEVAVLQAKLVQAEDNGKEKLTQLANLTQAHTNLQVGSVHMQCVNLLWGDSFQSASPP